MVTCHRGRGAMGVPVKRWGTFAFICVLLLLSGCPGPDPKPVVFGDPEVEAEVRREIGVMEGDIYPDMLTGVGLDFLWLIEPASLQGLQYCLDLERLILGGGTTAVDLEPIRHLPKLRNVAIAAVPSPGLAVLSSAPALEALWVFGYAVEDETLAEIGALTQLRYLSLTNLSTDDLTPLSALTGLERLTLHGCDLPDLSPLAALDQLTFLRIKDSGITDPSPLSGLTRLEDLYLACNGITDLSFVSAMTNLEELWIARNAVMDLTPLHALAADGALQRACLQENPLSADATDVQIPALEALGCVVATEYYDDYDEIFVCRVRLCPECQ